MRPWLIVLSVFGALAAHAAGDVCDPAGTDGKAVLNWTQGTITAKGIGPIDESAPRNMQKVYAMRVARADAQRNLAEAVDGVHVTAQTTVKMYKLVDDQIRTQIDTYLKGFSTLSEGWDDPDKSIYQVTLVLPLYGLLQPVQSALVAPTGEKQAVRAGEALGIAPPPPARSVDVPDEQPAPPTPLPERKPGPYTGLVIDTRGFHLERAMAPKIMTKDESEVWGTVKVAPEYVLKTGIVGFSPSLEIALDPSRSRAGANPLVIRAIGRHGSFRANAVVTDEDAKLLLDENGKADPKFLDTFKVVFVIDPS